MPLIFLLSEKALLAEIASEVAHARFEEILCYGGAF